MRILHTADWHAGKKLGPVDRSPELAQAIDEIVEIATDQKVDLAIVAGDLLDRALPPLDAIGLVIDGLSRLAEAAGQVVAIAGNHDSEHLFELFAPLLKSRNVHLAGRIRRPQDGGVITLPSSDGKQTAQIALMPFLKEAEVVDFMADSAEWHSSYQHKIRTLAQALCKEMDSGAVRVLTGHFFVEGSELGGGERQIHVGEQYATTGQAISPNVQYAALGHIHKPQAVPGSPIPARYSGSPLQLDFSERTHQKEVVVVDVSPESPAKVTPIPLTSGRQLIRVTDSLESLKSRSDEFGDAYLDVRVETGGPVFGIAEDVRRFLPNALFVQAVYEREEAETIAPADKPLVETYADFHQSEHGSKAPKALLDVLRTLEDQVDRQAS